MCGPEELNQKCSSKYWISLFSILIRVFNLKLVDGKSPDEKFKFPRLSSSFRLILDLCWLILSLNLATVDPTYCLRHILACQCINYATIVTINWKIKVVFFLGNLAFKLISTSKYFTYITVRMATHILVSAFCK